MAAERAENETEVHSVGARENLGEAAGLTVQKGVKEEAGVC